MMEGREIKIGLIKTFIYCYLGHLSKVMETAFSIFEKTLSTCSIFPKFAG
jgi:hypothetical protein